MKLLICDSSRISTFVLPSKVEDYFIINYYYSLYSSSFIESITLEAKDGEWFLLTDESLKIKENDVFLSSVCLKEGSFYKAIFSDIEENIYFYVIGDNSKYLDYSVLGTSSIVIGNSNEDTICFPDNNLLAKQIIITKLENNYHIQNYPNDKIYAYLNENTFEEAILKTGDVIFLNGLRIIWMGSFIKVIQTGDKILVVKLNPFSDSQTNNNYTLVGELDKKIKLFRENDIFFHTPRIKSDIEEYSINIELPPSSFKEQGMPMIFTLGSSIMFGLISCVSGVTAVQGLIQGTVSKSSAIVELVICFLMIVSSVLFPVFSDLWEKNRQKKMENLRQVKYKEYLEKNMQLMNQYVSAQEKILKENNLNQNDIMNDIVNRSRLIWRRNIFDNDFLSVTLGIGDIPAKINIVLPNVGFSLEDDNLKKLVFEKFSKKPILKNIPVSMSLIENRVLPILIDIKDKIDFINSIMLQLIYYHSARDLKIVIFTNQSYESRWEYFRYLSHCWNNKFNKRFFAINEEESADISLYLESIYEKRISESGNNGTNDSNAYLNFSEYYLIVTDDFKSVRDIPIINKIMDSQKNIGFSLLIFESSINNLPSKFNNFVNITNDVCGVFGRKVDLDNQVKFKTNYLKNLDMDYYAQILANIPIYSRDVNTDIPSSLSFLEMYGVGRVDQLNILSRWSNNDPTISLKAPVGEKEKGKLLDLDLHEKFHGPHGLIAGSTGSGKSEFIITYILSMAINYHPYEVQFILIDYKGGGLALAFENRETGIKIPHLVGTITNLDVSEMNRTLVSLNSELQRRQKIFNDTRNKLGESTVDIYKYQRFYREGKVSEPMSHLFVISDEFAELRSQQPEFMEELISTARIGRSLGVHLILATQKPSGVVNDQIWSNTRFRVCLRVQSTEDSTEMLKRPEAASIKESGRFYLQVGTNEIFELAQSGWAGALYTPVDRVIKKSDDSLNFVNNCGDIIKSINDNLEKKEHSDYGDQLTSIVNYLYEIANREKIKFSSLWLPSLSNDIYMEELLKKYKFLPSREKFNVVIGEYDQPSAQIQGLYEMKLISSNTVIFGNPGCGKENLITSILFSACINYSPLDVQFYILDFGAQVLKYFSYMPHVGDVLFSEDKDKFSSVFSKLEREIKKRKILFSDYDGSFSSYLRMSGKSVPLLVLVLNEYEAFRESEVGDYDDELVSLLREGSKYGVIFIVTSIAVNSIRSGMLDCFENKILLQIQDPFDYEYILKASHGLIPKKTFGRGIGYVYQVDDVCEFQTCFICDKNQISSYVKSVGNYLYQNYKYKAPAIKLLPSKVTYKEMRKYLNSISSIPIGYLVDDVQVYGYNFLSSHYNIILGNNLTDNVTFFGGLIDLIDSINNISFTIIDFIDSINFEGNAIFYQNQFDDAFNDICNYTFNEMINIYFIIGIGNIFNVLDSNEMNKLNYIIDSVDKFPNNYFIFVDDLSRFKNISSCDWYNKLDFSSGIWVGNGFEDQDVFDVNLDNLENVELGDIAYVIKNNNYQLLKVIGDGSSENDEERSLSDFLNG